MFGQNEVRGKIPYNGRWAVQEVFHTIQGEGPLAGLPAVFLRMRHCNLRCTFCDTDFTSGTDEPTTDELLKRIDSCRSDSRVSRSTRLVVITGGEPMLQDLGHIIVPIITTLNMAVQVETAGTVWPESFDQPGMRLYLDNPDYFTIVCSPKTPKVHASVEQHCRHWKYIITSSAKLSDVDGLPMSGTQPGVLDAALHRPRKHFLLGDRRRNTIWVQPCEEYLPAQPGAVSTDRDDDASATAQSRVINTAMQFGHRVSLQTHKLMGLP